MLLDLPTELINVITDYLRPRPIWPRVRFDACTCLPEEDLDRQLLLYDVPYSGTLDRTKSYATDTLRLATAHPHIAQSIVNGGWQGVVEMSNIVDLDVVRCIPEGFRSVVRTFDLTAVPLSTILSPTVQAVLHKFPAIRRIDVEFDWRRDQIRSEPYMEVPTTADATNSLRPPFQITDLVSFWSYGDIAPLTLFATSFPLPLLERLYITDPHTISAFPKAEDVEKYRERFEQLERVAVLWRSLESVQVCIQVLLDWSSGDHEDLTIWNTWQIALTSLFHAFRSNPSCKIGVCITYMFDTASFIPLDQTFQNLPNGKHTLCNRMAPIDASSVRTFLARFTGQPIPRFDLSIKHGEEGGVPVQLVKVSYHPPSDPSPGPSSSSMEGTTECSFYHERLDKLYERAQDGEF